MGGDLISAATVLAGSGAAGWLAEKLLGPSFSALGEQAKIYATDRLAKIFERTKALTDDREIKQLAPGFALVVLQRASISEDSAEITEMWANLIASAATEQSSRHVIYVDILSQIGKQEALILASMDRRKVPNFAEFQRAQLSKLQTSLQKLQIGYGYGDQDTESKLDAIMSIDQSLLGSITAVEITNKRNGEIFNVMRRVENAISYDILERQRLVQRSLITTIQDAVTPKIYFSTLTDLGDDFVRTCTREEST